MLSDHDGAVSKLYDVYNPANGIANRTTFVIDSEGKIVNIIEGSEAIEVSNAETACSRIKKK